MEIVDFATRKRFSSQTAIKYDQVIEMIRIYTLWHCRIDDEGRDHDKLLGVYSTQEKAEEGRALLQDKPGFRDLPDGFEINDLILDKTYMTDGFVTLWGDEDPNSASKSSD